jgi:integral membrane protein
MAAPWWRRPIGRLRWVGLLEGCSFLALLGVAMPLKYLADQPMAVTVVGAIHGALFLAYGLALVDAWLSHNWRLATVAGFFAASVLPFGPFVADRRLQALERAAPSPPS